jgi:hypothetical protein
MGLLPKPKGKEVFDEHWAVPEFRQVAPNVKYKIKISLKELCIKSNYTYYLFFFFLLFFFAIIFFPSLII